LSVQSVRVVDVIPGKSVIGLEIPNVNREIVYLSEILRSKEYDKIASPLALALGKDIGGRPTVVDLAQDAASAGRRHHGFRQVGCAERDGAVAAVQGDRTGRAHADDRPEDAGTVGLPGHPAPARAGRHRHEGSRERPALVRRRDGAALQADVGRGRAQSRRLQQEGAGRRSQPASRSSTRCSSRRRTCRRPANRWKPCPTSSSSSTSSPT
jgi:hypothetical protein